MCNTASHINKYSPRLGQNLEKVKNEVVFKNSMMGPEDGDSFRL